MDEEPAFTVTHAHHNFHIVTVPTMGATTGDEVFRALLRSDAHHDSPHNLWKMEESHLKQAMEYGAPILDAGDCFDVMQTRRDPRREMGGKQAEHERLNYMDRVVEDAATDYAPYAPNWVMLGEGNHESAILKHLGTDMPERLATMLRERADTNVRKGGYFGWVKFKFHICGAHISKLVAYYHGTGGGAPVTQGVIHSQRNSRKYPDADVVWTGHLHTEWAMTWARFRANRYNRLYEDEQLHICTPGYKRIQNPSRGFEVERCGNEPKPVGAAWLTFRWEATTKTIIVDRERAK